MEPLKIFMYYQIMNVIIIIYQNFNMNLVWTPFQLVSNILSIYFYDTKVVQTLYPTSHKLNVGPYGFIFLFQNI
jgi:hypothetical protein